MTAALDRPQVESTHYVRPSYLELGRWLSFHAQYRAVLEATDPGAWVVEVGAGSGVLSGLLSASGFSVCTVDIDPELSPSLLASIDALPLRGRSVDTLGCFQVLEHLPFDRLDTCLWQLQSVAARTVIISVPVAGPSLQVAMKVPRIGVRTLLSIKVPARWRRHRFNGEHYWELGTRQVSLARFRASLSRYFEIQREFQPLLNDYHRFFILRPRLAR